MLSIIVDVDKYILDNLFFHKYVLLIHINICCVIDTVTNITSPGFIHNNIHLHLLVAKTSDTPLFFELFKNFEGIKKPSFHRETLPSIVTHSIIASGSSVHSRLERLAQEKFRVEKVDLAKC